MKKLIYTIGDSWTYGYNLKNRETESYPYLLSKKLDCDLVNEALPAAPNDWIFRKSIEWISKNDTSNIHTFIVGWSASDRREEQFKFFHGGPPKWERKNCYWDGHLNRLSKWISEKLSNPKLQLIKSFTYIYSLQQVLKSNNINYLFYFPWEPVLIQDDWYKDEVKIDVHDIYLKIDKNHCVGPKFNGIEVCEYGLHPNKSQHRFISEQIYHIIGDKK